MKPDRLKNSHQKPMIKIKDELRAKAEELVAAAREERTEDAIQSIVVSILTEGRGRKAVVGYLSGSGPSETCPPPPQDSLFAQAARAGRPVIVTREIPICTKQYLPIALSAVKEITGDLSLATYLADQAAAGHGEEYEGPISAAVQYAWSSRRRQGKPVLVLEPASSVAEEFPEQSTPACETLTAKGQEYILCGCSVRQLREHPAFEMNPDNRDEMLLAAFIEKLREETTSEAIKSSLDARGISEEDLGGEGKSENGK